MKFYFSHSIRGKFGDKATNEQMQHNCELAHTIAELICKELPQIELYVPGDHDLFVQIAYKSGYITEKQILDVDCMILDQCEGVIIYALDGQLYGGCITEYEYALDKNKPIKIFSTVTEVINWLAEYIMRC